MNALMWRRHSISARVFFALILVFGCVTASLDTAFAQQADPADQNQISRSLHLHFDGEQPHPLAMVTGDFDEDGIGDLAIGYALSKGGSVLVLRGNLDAHAPQTHESWLAAGQHEYSDPYLQNSKPISVDSRPGLMTAADVNGDGHLDLVFATKGGSQLFAMFGDGKGNFLSPVSATVDGGVTALTAYRPGVPFMSEVIVLGQQSNNGAKLSILSYSSNTWTKQASYSLPGRATAMTVANLDADSIPDTAIVAGGQLLILHGKAALSGQNALTTVPGSDVESVIAGSFLFDRHAQLQLSVLTAGGDVVTLAHEGFDPRPYTPQEIGKTRRRQRRGSNQTQTLAQQAGNTGYAPWVEIERYSGAAVHASGDRAAILLRSRRSGSGGDDLVVVNSSQQQQTVISHPLTAAHSLSSMAAAATPASQISYSNLSTGNVVAAVAAPVTPGARQSLVLFSADNVSPQVTLPSTGNTFYVNTTADNTGTNVDPSDGIRCTQGSAERCTLRDAITFINNDAADNIGAGTSDTIMLPAGTYNLTWQAGTFDGNGNGVTHLEVLGPVTIIGDSASDTIVNGNDNDIIFTINPGPYGSFNSSGSSYVFDATLENLTIENAKNLNDLDTSPTGYANYVGGCINWDADGPGNLTIVNSVIKNCQALWGPGGGIWTENSVGAGTGTLILSGDTIENNSTAEQGGGLFTANPPTAVSATNTVFSNNTAQISVNPNDFDSVGAGGGLYFSARPDASSTPRSTLTNVTVSSNTAGDDNGGGIYTNTGLLITSSLIENNSAKAWGGGIHSEVVSPETQTTITSSNFISNSAAATGGAISGGPATAAEGNILQVSLSRIVGNTSASGASGLAAGVSAGQSGEVIATENWWGCNNGPTTASDGCDQAVLYNSSTGSLSTAPFAKLGFSSDITSIPPAGSMNLTLSLNRDSNNNPITGAFPAVATNCPFTFTVSGVTESPALTTGTFNTSGIGTAVLTPTSTGNGTVTATFDNQTDTINFTSQAGTATSLSITAPSITFGQTASISMALTPSNATGITAADFTATIDNTPLSITSTATPNVFILSGSALASLNGGIHPIQVNFAGASSYSPSSASTSLQVNKATLNLAWTPTSPIVYGTALSPAQLNATATFNGNPVAGTFSYSSGSGTVLGVGPHTLTVSFTPSDAADFNTPTPITANVTVTQAAPVLTWSPSSPIVYGTPLSFAQLNASATHNGTPIAGTFNYSTAFNTVLGVGPHTLTVSFTPSDTTDYSTPAPITANITVTPDTPVISWSPSSPIVYGTALSAAQLNATASNNGSAVAGTFSYSPALGTVLTGGTHTLTVTFTPSDMTDYSTPAPATKNITVSQGTPVLAWSQPSPIVSGTALSAAQLNATASYNGTAVAGTFSYNPALGTVLSAGTHTLTATFTPSDTTDYSTPAPAIANVVVTPATPVLGWMAPASITYGTALTSTQLSATATYNGNQVQGVFTYTTGSGTVLSVGMNTLTATFIPNDSTDYSTPTGTVSTTITVTPATPMLQWATPASITYGAALTGAQLSAAATNLGSPVSGTFTYTPALGTVLSVGSHTLSATFTPNDTTDYSTPTGTVSTIITVTAATPTLQWAAPASITYGTALTNSQLNATASYNGSQVSGSFTYNPGPGTVLSAGSHTLSVSFTPTDTTTYGAPAPITTNLTVSQDTLTIIANNATRVYGTANPTFAGAIHGELPADSFTESFVTPATSGSPVGSYPIMPSVTGINLTNYAVTTQSGVLTVTPAGTTVTLNTTSTTTNAGANVTLTATVLSTTAGVPTGSVQFLDGSTVLCNGVLGAQGVGTYTASSLGSGEHQITAVYAGDTNFTGSSSSQSTVTIGSPGYSLQANPASLTLKAGQTGEVSLTFTPVGGFTGTVSLSCAGLPAGVSCNFAPSNLTADGSNKQQTAQLTIFTLGSNQGTVSMNRRDGSSSGPLQASVFLLPGMFFGGFLMWQRKKLHVRNGQLLMLLILAASLTGMVGCGNSPLTATLGSSTVTVTATAAAVGSGASNTSVNFRLTIVE